MPDSAVRFDELVASLKERNFRLTPQRLKLLRLIAASEGHPSAAQLHDRVRRQYPTMSLATVYKTLAVLKDLGQVLEIDLRDDSHYDGNRPQAHPHLICMNCNRILDAEVSLDQESVKRAARASGFTVLRPQITLYGLCPDCRRAN